MEWILLSIVVLGVIFIALPLIKVFKGTVSALSAKKRIILHIGLFATFFFAVAVVAPFAFAADLADP